VVTSLPHRRRHDWRARADCRRRNPTENYINKRVEELQKAIKKAKKEGVAAPEYRKDGLPTSESNMRRSPSPLS